MLTEKTFDAGELTLNYAEGPASGPAMVLLHGLSLWRQSWDALIPELTSSWHVFAFDLRGHGKSGRVANEYHVVDYSRDIVAFLRSSAKPTVLVGHSLGGFVALVAAGEYPEGVRAVVSVDPGPVRAQFEYLHPRRGLMTGSDSRQAVRNLSRFQVRF